MKVAGTIAWIGRSTVDRRTITGLVVASLPLPIMGPGLGAGGEGRRPSPVRVGEIVAVESQAHGQVVGHGGIYGGIWDMLTLNDKIDGVGVGVDLDFTTSTYGPTDSMGLVNPLDPDLETSMSGRLMGVTVGPVMAIDSLEAYLPAFPDARLRKVSGN